MHHRHLLAGTTPPLRAEIDDIIERGSLDDWIRLGRSIEHDLVLRDRVQELARQSAVGSERPDRPHFWIAFCAYLESRKAEIADDSSGRRAS